MHKRINRELLVKVLLVLLLLFGFFYRIWGLEQNYSFWTDENQTAIFSRAVLERGSPRLLNGYTPGIYLPFWYYLPAFTMKIFGISNFSVRLPSVIFGTLTILFTFILAKKIFDEKVAFISALFITFLKIEILWSRQARPYQLLQMLLLALLVAIVGLTENYKKVNTARILNQSSIPIVSLLLAMVHPLGLGLVLIILTSVVFLHKDLVRDIWQKSKLFLFASASLAVLFLGLGGMVIIKHTPLVLGPISGLLGSAVQNLKYYHSFFWRQYGLVTFFALLGSLHLIFNKIKKAHLTIITLVFYLLFVVLFADQPFVRYVYVVFPLLVILFSYMIVKSAKTFLVKRRMLNTAGLALLVFFIIASGYKFTLFPKKIYSLNEDMQEIPEVDYIKIYQLISNKLEQDNDAVFSSNWNDHAIWFLGEGRLDYIIRQTTQNTEREPFSGAVYIRNLEKFKEVMEKNNKGIVMLESWDDAVPKEVSVFIKDNLKKELEIDRLYSVQPRYWPVTVYSWGLD